MFEARNGSKFQVYNNITDNLFDWKQYNSTLRLNKHNLLEIVVDLQDVTFIGTKNYLEQIDEVVNRIQIRSNSQIIKKEAINYCLNTNTSCPKTIQTSRSDIYNALSEMYYGNYTELNDAQKEELVLKIENLTAQYRSDSQAEYFDFVTEYHTTFLEWKLVDYEQEKLRLIS